MSLLSEMLNELKDSQVDCQVKKICDKIFDEEKDGMKNLDVKPKGANTYLSLQVNYKPKEISFLSLEREGPEEYIIILYSKKDDNIERSLKRIKVWEVNESKAEKIMKRYGSVYRFVNEK